MADSSRNQVFISYSHADSGWLEKLRTHLKPFIRGGTIAAWSDTEIRPGAKWEQEIDDALSAAKVAVLLVSPSFLASDFMANQELPRLLEMAERQDVEVLWVAISASSYKATKIADYQAVNNPSQPLDSLTTAELSRELVKIAEQIAVSASASQRLPPRTPLSPRAASRRSPKVFISYSHDSDEHSRRVLGLAERLRKDGIDASIDQYESAPVQGWVPWTEQQLRSADFVLMVCTDNYRKRLEDQHEPGVGAGAFWDSTLIYQHLYNEGSRNKRFIPVLLSGSDVANVPSLLLDFTQYIVSDNTGYDQLVRRILNQPAVELPQAGPLTPVSVASEQKRAAVLSGLRVFLCHSSSDKQAVRSLYLRLRGEGAVPWFDEENLIPGQDWDKEIVKAVRATDVVLVCLSKHSISAVGYLKREIGYALDAADQRKDDNIFLIPVRLDQSEVPDRLHKWHWVNLFDEGGYDKLLRSLEERVKTLNAAQVRTPSIGHRMAEVFARYVHPSLRFGRTVGLLALMIGISYGVVKFVKSFDRPPFSVRSSFIGPGTHTKPAAVVFVHGIFGEKDSTWQNEGASFPALLDGDPKFRDQLDVFLYEYFTPKFKTAASIVSLADQLRGSLDDNRIFDDHEKVVFLSHSMGGLVVRQFLLSNRNRLAKIPMLYFAATPTNGSELTLVAKSLSGNPQLRGMLPLEGNDLLQSIQSGWLGWNDVRSVPSYCAYETLPTDGVTVVSMSSATALCNQALDPISANHIDIVKPTDRGDQRYTRFATALRSSLQNLSVRRGYKKEITDSKDRHPANESHSKLFAHYTDRRSLPDDLLRPLGVGVARSFALVAGVSNYPLLASSPTLPPAKEDIHHLISYLRDRESFDEIVVLEDEDMTLDNLQYFLQDYFPRRLRQFPKSRFLFAYSGHGVSSKDNFGYLLKSTARSFEDIGNSVSLKVLRSLLDEVIEAGHQSLVLLNSCNSGIFSRQAFGTVTNQQSLKLQLNEPGAQVITAGDSTQAAWHDPLQGPGSVFFETLFTGLAGDADLNSDGFITVFELQDYMVKNVYAATHGSQRPTLGDLHPGGSRGGLFFLNPRLARTQQPSPSKQGER